MATAKKTVKKAPAKKSPPKAEPVEHDDVPASRDGTQEEGPSVSAPGERAPDGGKEPPAPEPPKRKRGRPPGSGKGKASKAKAAQVGLAGQIQGLHAIVGIATGIPEAYITEQQAEMLAEAITTVSEEYGLSLSGKTGALLQLAGTAAMIYVPRVFTYQKRRAAERAGAATPPSEGAQGESAVN